MSSFPSSTPLVSIIVAVYNRPDLLKRALTSLEKQTYSHWECIVVDDGSRDNTIDIAMNFVKRDDRFLLIKEQHKGRSYAKNSGLMQTRGKYVCFLDSDDEYLPQHMSLRIEELQKNPELDVVHGGFVVIGNDLVPDLRDMSKKISLYSQDVYLGITSFGRRAVFTSLGGFRDIPYGDDTDFLRRAEKELHIKQVKWPTYLYHRDNPDSRTNNLLKEISE